MIHDNVLGTIGRTPLVRLHRVVEGLACTVVGKLEAFSPGGSVKDRTAARIVAEAERRGALKPGGTIVESTSGNMGVGLALVAAVKGYRCVVCTTDKQSEDKINLVRAFGAEVRICPTAVEPDDPRSFYSVAKKIAAETPGAFYANQFHSLDNPAAHYATTGPEIWEDTGAKVDVVVGGLGTGGTLCGAGRFLKEKNPKIRIVGVDPFGSLFYDWFHHKTLVKAQGYKIEGIGEDILPGALDFSVLDDVVQVQDKESFLAARRLTREEGILAGTSAGAALVGLWKCAKTLPAGALVVVIIPERGERALGKIYNDEWMRRNQFLAEGGDVCAADLVDRKARDMAQLVTLPPNARIGEAIRIMQESDVSQIPIIADGQVVGNLREDQIIDLLLHTPQRQDAPVEEIMEDAVPEVAGDAPAGEVQEFFVNGHSAVLVRLSGGRRGILTKYDLIHGLAKR
jgi:cystathionine beta-synthase